MAGLEPAPAAASTLLTGRRFHDCSIVNVTQGYTLPLYRLSCIPHIAQIYRRASVIYKETIYALRPHAAFGRYPAPLLQDG